jgi:hypothetical protein
MAEADAPVNQIEPTVGSTSWLDLRAKLDRQRQWLNDISKPPKGPRIYHPQGSAPLADSESGIE